jgi:hypothetical protein
MYHSPLLSKAYSWMAMRFYRLAEWFLRYSQKVDAGTRKDGIPTIMGNPPPGDEPPAHWLEMARTQAPQLYRSVLSRRIAAARKALTVKVGNSDVVADTLSILAERPDNLPSFPGEGERGEEVLPGESRERFTAKEESTGAPAIDAPDGEPVTPVDPGRAFIPKRPANLLAHLKPRWIKSRAKPAPSTGTDPRDVVPDRSLPRTSAVDASGARGEWSPSGIRQLSASSSGATGQRRPAPCFADTARERAQNARERVQKEREERTQSANIGARQGALRSDTLGDGMTSGFTPPETQEITGGGWGDGGSDAAKGLSARSQRSFKTEVETSRERRMAVILGLSPATTSADRTCLQGMTGMQAQRFPEPAHRGAESVEPARWASLPDQLGKEGEELPWASLPDDVWTQPLQRAVFDSAGSLGHELYGSDDHKLIG